MVGVLEGAVETKVRPAVVIASSTYLMERPDALVGFLTTPFKIGRWQDSARSPTFVPMC